MSLLLLLLPAEVGDTAGAAGGQARRHQGLSTGPQQQQQRFVGFRWTLTIRIEGSIAASMSVAAPVTDRVAGGDLAAVITVSEPPLRMSGQIAATLERISPPFTSLNDDDEDLLPLLALL